VALFN